LCFGLSEHAHRFCTVEMRVRAALVWIEFQGNLPYGVFPQRLFQYSNKVSGTKYKNNVAVNSLPVQ
jgi:hypothetical protein